ncbi:MAG: DUF2288 domain-containing protein [Verrucomicrobiaceae bacterium]|nr:DUF2288 domain-containing protein [Verrucomicrobiaceae bacterium]
MTISGNQNHDGHQDENSAGNDGVPAGNHLAYGILGDDPTTSSEKLEKYTGEVTWDYLRPHFTSGALLYVDPALSLTEVGHAFANDDAEQVREWRKTGDLVTPSAPHAAYWEESKARFRALVVSPFVLIQPLDPK